MNTSRKHYGRFLEKPGTATLNRCSEIEMIASHIEKLREQLGLLESSLIAQERQFEELALYRYTHYELQEARMKTRTYRPARIKKQL